MDSKSDDKPWGIMPLNDVTICITSFLRPGYLRACLEGIRINFPECEIVVADDSGSGIDLTPQQPMANTRWVSLPYDTGLTGKRNRAVMETETPYWFCGADDFDFTTPGFRQGLETAAGILDARPDIDLVGGRVDGNPYESDLRYDAEKNVMHEVKLVPDGSPFQQCDLVVNAFLARTATLREVPWDEDVRPIGGEHGQFFLHMKTAGKITVWLPGWGLNTLKLGYGSNMQDPKYASLRGRAVSTGHRIMLKKENLNDWVGW